MQIDIEKLIEIIVREVIAELSKGKGDLIIADAVKGTNVASAPVQQEKQKAVIKLDGYKTPVLTEHHLKSVGATIKEIEVPRGTVLTPGARDIIKKRKLTLGYL